MMAFLGLRPSDGASEKEKRRTRIVSVVAATTISLACGTNYAYSAWAPQFAAKLRLSSTEINLIGTMGNLGMYGVGIPVGLLVDSKGPNPSVFIGSILVGTGYFGIYKAHLGGQGSIALPWLCFFAILTGIGGAGAFAGAIKTSALNWPHHRGTATAFPLSAFGLSALFFSFFSQVAFPGYTGRFLLLLSIGCFCMIFFSNFLLRVVPHTSSYQPIPTSGERTRPQRLLRSKSNERKRSRERFAQEPDETSSLISSTQDPDESGEGGASADEETHDTHHLDIRGLKMIPHVEFWQLWMLLGLLTGIGLMTINNIGNDAQALWALYDPSVSSGWIQQRQMIHVMVLSLCSFTGRLLSGVGSDVIVKKLHMSRFWCLVVSSVIFCFGQLGGALIANPHYLFFVSGAAGLAYGFLFGVYPSIVAEIFGVHGLSQNWGWMTLSPIIWGNIFNLMYGSIYDHHSVIDEHGHRQCLQGLQCYSAAYWMTFGASLLGLLISLWSIRWNGRKRGRRKSEGREA